MCWFIGDGVFVEDGWDVFFFYGVDNFVYLLWGVLLVGIDWL